MFKKMVKSRPEDALVKLVKTVETARTAHTACTAHFARTAHPAHSACTAHSARTAHSAFLRFIRSSIPPFNTIQKDIYQILPIVHLCPFRFVQNLLKR